MKNRVVVTGLGAVTPIGNEVNTFWQNICEGKSGIGAITKFDTTDYDCHIAGEVKGFEPENYMDKKETRRFDPFVQFGLAAASMAFKDAGLDINKEDAAQIGVIIGSGIGGVSTFQEQCYVLFEKGPKRVSPFFIPMMIVNMASGMVSIKLGAKGPNTTVSTACASGSHAIGDAFRILQRGDAQVMIAGGAEAAITKVGIAGFSSMGALSLRNNEPERASRPFDKGRSGFVMGEGAGVVILETLEHAEKRGIKIYAELIGYGMSGDAYHISSPAPCGAGAAQCMEMALRDAGIAPTQVEYINAHGTSTDIGDKLETMAVKAVFKEHAYKLAMSSTKSITGHLLGASGGIELIASILALRDGIIPPTINYEEKDPDCDLDYVPNNSRKQELDIVLSNSFGFGGHNATLIAKKFRA